LVDCDIIVVCVPTPLTEDRQPDLRFIENAAASVSSVLRAGQLVILESTTFPGTTREVVLPRLAASGLRPGEEFFLAFSPERVDPGNATYRITNTPKVAGGVDSESTELALLFYRQMVEQVVPVSSPEAAEMVKLLENTFRSVNIALANEMAEICDRLGIDVWEVIDAASTKPFGFMPFYPGPGAGGHCIPLDPIYLSWKMRSLNYATRFIELASTINEQRPHYVAERVAQALLETGRWINGANVLVLGVSYKADVADTRESPALEMIAALNRMGARVSYHDPLVASVAVDGVQYQSVALTSGRLQEADCVIVAADHRAIDFRFVARHASLIVDTRNAFKFMDVPAEKLIRL
jgi:UDP-N-acetyl-D-glucosamine dehydrogenase